MDMSNKDEFSAKKRDCDTSSRYCDSVNASVDWRISFSNSTISYPPENPMSICHASSQMMDSSRQNLCPEGSSNVHTDTGTSVRVNDERPLQMGWNMAQFPADSGFIERAANFSFFGCGSFGEMMMNQQSLGVPESVGLFLQDTENAGGSKLVNVSDDSQSSGGNGHDAKCGETSSKGFNRKKRKGTVKDSEPDQSQRAQHSGEEQEDTKQKDGQSPNAYAKKMKNDPPKDGYIHMRARRGQATNSHSLAERVRREKISESMKFLQDLVPGCDKVTGKAVMLDEIINYVQSLQCQIEFLSMKLSTLNPPVDFNLESLLAKDSLQVAAPTFPQSMPMLYPPPLHLSQTNFMQPNHFSISLLHGGLKRQEAQRYENDHHNGVHVNGTGTAPDHEDATGESKIPLLSDQR